MMNKDTNKMTKEDVIRELEIMFRDLQFNHELGAYPRGDLINLYIAPFDNLSDKRTFNVCITLFPETVKKESVENIEIFLDYYGNEQINKPIGWYHGKTNHRGQIYFADIPKGTYRAEVEVFAPATENVREIGQVEYAQFSAEGFYKKFPLFQGHLMCILREDENDDLIASFEEAGKKLYLESLIVKFSLVNATGNPGISGFALLSRSDTLKRLYAKVNIETILERYFKTLSKPEKAKVSSPRSLIPDDTQIHVSVENIESLLLEDIDQIEHSIFACMGGVNAITEWKNVLCKMINSEKCTEKRKVEIERLLKNIENIKS